MDQKTIVKVLGPAAAFGVLLLLLGLVMMPPGEPSKPKTTAVASGNASPARGDDSGMSDVAPSPDAPEWQPGPGNMKIWDVKEGEGDPCLPGANVVIHYTG
jgi:hypothetical protein